MDGTCHRRRSRSPDGFGTNGLNQTYFIDNDGTGTQRPNGTGKHGDSFAAVQRTATATFANPSSSPTTFQIGYEFVISPVGGTPSTHTNDNDDYRAFSSFISRSTP